MTKTALVIGGGVAGMTAALAMQKAGLEPIVFERHPGSADGVGAFLTLAVNGLETLQEVDVDVTKIGGFETPRMELRLGDGRLLTAFHHGPEGADRARTRTIRRADLYGSLRREADRRGIEIRYGKSITSAERRGDAVVAQFGDGTAAEGELLVGADGLRSRVRALIDPKAPDARYVGLLNAGGYARGVKVEGEVGTMHMIFGKRCFFGFMPAPDGDVWWFANPARANDPSPAELAATSMDAWRAELLETFRDDVGPACALIEASDEMFAGWPTYDFPTVPIWHRDRMLVIGDAAHAASPSSGQGASMAIEDGVMLGKTLRDEPDVDRAFARYEQARRKRVERMVVQGKRGGDGKTPGPFGRAVRDLMLRMIFTFAPVASTSDWIYAERIRWADPIARAA